ncbi:18805_t:CDS:2 [Racocetra fulgida]|uniref:18805_t:CDS:1 n=1 Tax=Racocetra fulgida TaxID=60492 RepID=A0A9N8ZA18_9GLOM|nr:18805_t:CDS:2 [Racocetra fulgida]
MKGKLETEIVVEVEEDKIEEMEVEEVEVEEEKVEEVWFD